MRQDNAIPENNATGSMETEPEMLNEDSPQEQGVEKVDSQESPQVLPGHSGTEFVPLVAEINAELNRLHGRMHGLDAILREGDARSLELEEQGRVIKGLHDEVTARDGEIGCLHGEIDALSHALKDNAQHSRERLDE